jgi:hypothetical protein
VSGADAEGGGGGGGGVVEGSPAGANWRVQCVPRSRRQSSCVCYVLLSQIKLSRDELFGMMTVPLTAGGWPVRNYTRTHTHRAIGEGMCRCGPASSSHRHREDVAGLIFVRAHPRRHAQAEATEPRC